MENKVIKEVAALDLKNVKNALAIKFHPKGVMLKAVTVGSNGLIDASGKAIGTNSWWEVVKVGDDVKLCEVGDIVLDFNTQGANYLSKGQDTFIIVKDYSLEIWVNEKDYIR